MLGQILRRLTDAATAEATLAVVGKPELRRRIERAAASDGVPVGDFLAGKVRHLVDHGDDDVWLDLIAAMSGSAQPAAAAVERVLGRAFPDPVRVRVTRRRP
jgi:hypothetical protein